MSDGTQIERPADHPGGGAMIVSTTKSPILQKFPSVAAHEKILKVVKE